MGKYFLEEFRHGVLRKAIGRSRDSESDGFKVSDELSVVDEMGFGDGLEVKQGAGDGGSSVSLGDVEVVVEVEGGVGMLFWEPCGRKKKV